MRFCLTLKDEKFLVLNNRKYSLLAKPKTLLYESDDKRKIMAMKQQLSTQPLVFLSDICSNGTAVNPAGDKKLKGAIETINSYVEQQKQQMKVTDDFQKNALPSNSHDKRLRDVNMTTIVVEKSMEAQNAVNKNKPSEESLNEHFAIAETDVTTNMGEYLTTTEINVFTNNSEKPMETLNDSNKNTVSHEKIDHLTQIYYMADTMVEQQTKVMDTVQKNALLSEPQNKHLRGVDMTSIMVQKPMKVQNAVNKNKLSEELLDEHFAIAETDVTANMDEYLTTIEINVPTNKTEKPMEALNDVNENSVINEAINEKVDHLTQIYDMTDTVVEQQTKVMDDVQKNALPNESKDKHLRGVNVTSVMVVKPMKDQNAVNQNKLSGESLDAHFAIAETDVTSNMGEYLTAIEINVPNNKTEKSMEALNNVNENSAINEAINEKVDHLTQIYDMTDTVVEQQTKVMDDVLKNALPNESKDKHLRGVNVTNIMIEKPMKVQNAANKNKLSEESLDAHFAIAETDMTTNMGENLTTIEIDVPTNKMEEPIEAFDDVNENTAFNEKVDYFAQLYMTGSMVEQQVKLMDDVQKNTLPSESRDKHLQDVNVTTIEFEEAMEVQYLVNKNKLSEKSVSENFAISETDVPTNMGEYFTTTEINVPTNIEEKPMETLVDINKSTDSNERVEHLTQMYMIGSMVEQQKKVIGDVPQNTLPSESTNKIMVSKKQQAVDKKEKDTFLCESELNDFIIDQMDVTVDKDEHPKRAVDEHISHQIDEGIEQVNKHLDVSDNNSNASQKLELNRLSPIIPTNLLIKIDNLFGDKETTEKEITEITKKEKIMETTSFQTNSSIKGKRKCKFNNVRNSKKKCISPELAKKNIVTNEESNTFLLGNVQEKDDVQRTLTPSSPSDIEDPFSNPEFSEDEYIPNLEDEVSSAISSSTYSIESYVGSSKSERGIDVDIQKLKSIRRNLNFDDERVSRGAPRVVVISQNIICQGSKATTCSPTPSSSKVRKSKPEFKTIRGKLIIVGDCVKVFAISPLHAGCYRGFLIQNDADNRNIAMLEYPQAFSKHICKYEYNKTIVGQIKRMGMKFSFHLDCCIPAGKHLKGNEMYMDELKCYVSGLFVSNEESDINLTAKDLIQYKSKRHCCPYCHKIITNIGRHIKQMHCNEADVLNVLQMKPNSKERKETLKKIRLEGDFYHNKEHESNDASKVIVVRKPKLHCVSDSRRCDGCNGYYMRRNFSKHYRICKNIPKEVKLNLNPTIPPNKTTVEENNIGAKLLLGSLRQDEVGIIATKDPLLARTLASMYCPDACRYDIKKSNASQQLRRMARVLIEARKLNNGIKWWSDLLKPDRYDLLTKGIRIVSGLENSSLRNCSSRPQLALQYGPILTRLINQLLIDTLKDATLTHEQKNCRKEELQQLLKIHEMDFRTQVSSKALTITNVRKVYRSHDLPTPTDIHLLTKHLINISESSFIALKNKGFDDKVWRTLGESLLCQIVVFNRRRTGEASKILIENYHRKKNVDESDYDHLTRLQILLAKRYSVIYLSGKRVRPVPILLNKTQQHQLDLLIELRGNAGFTEDNPYLFPAHSKRDPFIKATVCLGKFAQDCGAQRPDLLTGSYLRRQVATVSQYLSLSDSEIQELADFMGHDVEVHKKHYRQPSAVMEITKMSRFLSVVGDKNINRHKGKTLNELEIPLDDLDADDTDSEEELPICRQETIDRPLTPLAADIRVASQSTSKSVSKKKNSPIKATPKKPLTQEILHKIYQQGSPHAYRKRRSVLSRVGWALHEKQFMQKQFGNFFNTDVPLPTKDYLKKILNNNSSQLHPSRTPDNMYAYIQNQRRKLNKPPAGRRPGRPSREALAQRAEELAAERTAYLAGEREKAHDYE